MEPTVLVEVIGIIALGILCLVSAISSWLTRRHLITVFGETPRPAQLSPRGYYLWLPEQAPPAAAPPGSSGARALARSRQPSSLARRLRQPRGRARSPSCAASTCPRRHASPALRRPRVSPRPYLRRPISQRWRAIWTTPIKRKLIKRPSGAYRSRACRTSRRTSSARQRLLETSRRRLLRRE